MHLPFGYILLVRKKLASNPFFGSSEMTYLMLCLNFHVFHSAQFCFLLSAILQIHLETISICIMHCIFPSCNVCCCAPDQRFNFYKREIEYQDEMSHSGLHRTYPSSPVYHDTMKLSLEGMFAVRQNWKHKIVVFKYRSWFLDLYKWPYKQLSVSCP